MNIFICGNPITKNKDNCVIFTQPNFMPSLSSFDSFPNIHKSKVSSFIENFYFLTMTENGFSYFYPDIDTGVNLCRFEWHYERNDNPYELRIGVSFKVSKGVLSEVGFYVVPHEHYEDFEKQNSEYELEDGEYEKIIESINNKVNLALDRVTSNPKITFNVLYYIQLKNRVKNLIEFNSNMYMLPSRLVDGKIVSAVVVRELAHSYLSAERFADEKVNLLCAIISLVSEGAKITKIEKYPVHVTPVDTHFNFSEENIDKFYPNTEQQTSQGNFLADNEIGFISDLVKLFDTHLSNSNKKRKVLNILFAFYSAIETEHVNQTVGLVSYVACLDAISKDCYPEYRGQHGSRKALVHSVVELLSKLEEQPDIDKWSKRIYNDHRSSYVYGANIRFEAFAQNMDGKNFAGLPKALPTETRVVSKQYEYNSDYMILKRATLAVLISYIEKTTDRKLPNVIQKDELTFKAESIPEAYISMPNNGWVRLT